jgi:hypothetical protein
LNAVWGLPGYGHGFGFYLAGEDFRERNLDSVYVFNRLLLG